MYVWLMSLSALLVVVLVVVLLWAVAQITASLDSIGGDPTSSLAKLRMGLRAIETETGHLAPAVVAVNGEFGKIAAGLQAVEGHLEGTIQAALRQGGN